MLKFRMLVRGMGLKAARAFGTNFIDAETGRPLGKGFVLAWRGRIHLIGLETPVRAMFLPQKRLTYWRQELGFTTYPRPDFPRIRPPQKEEKDRFPDR